MEPVKYLDPDGRIMGDSGYVRKKDSVGGLGHAGVYSRHWSGSYNFYEVTPLKDVKVTDSDHYKTDTITSEEKISKGGFPISLKNRNDIAVVRRTFENKQDMIDFLAINGYQDRMEFNTDSEKNAAIICAAEQLGVNFTNYDIPGNHCGIYTEKSLDARGHGLKNTLAGQRGFLEVGGAFTGNILYFLGLGTFLESPNMIGRQLQYMNGGKCVPNVLSDTQ